MKKLYANQKHSTAELQKKLGLSHYTLYAYCGNLKKIEKINLTWLTIIAKIENIEAEELWKQMKEYCKEVEQTYLLGGKL